MSEQPTTAPVEVRFTPWTTPAAIFRSDSADAIEYLTPILGSISTVLLFKLGRRLAAAESYTTTLQDLSQTIGGGPAVNGRSSLVNKAIARLVMFGYAQPISATTLRVRTEIPALPQRQLLRLPLELQRTIPVR